MTDPSGKRDPAARPNQIGAMSVRQGADEREVIFSRVFDAPRELVFKAWTDPELFGQWFAPPGYTAPVVEVDLRPGGEWKVVMRGPDGTDLPSRGLYLEIDEPSRIVMTDLTDDMPPDWHDLINRYRTSGDTSPLHLLLTVTFEEIDGQTTVTVTSRYQSKDDLEAILGIGAALGWAGSFDKLEALLATM
jgi:uncharacterized protein YndB with AHSA1/START domain